MARPSVQSKIGDLFPGKAFLQDHLVARLPKDPLSMMERMAAIPSSSVWQTMTPFLRPGRRPSPQWRADPAQMLDGDLRRGEGLEGGGGDAVFLHQFPWRIPSPSRNAALWLARRRGVPGLKLVYDTQGEGQLAHHRQIDAFLLGEIRQGKDLGNWISNSFA